MAIFNCYVSSPEGKQRRVIVMFNKKKPYKIPWSIEENQSPVENDAGSPWWRKVFAGVLQMLFTSWIGVHQRLNGRYIDTSIVSIVSIVYSSILNQLTGFCKKTAIHRKLHGYQQLTPTNPSFNVVIGSAEHHQQKWLFFLKAAKHKIQKTTLNWGTRKTWRLLCGTSWDGSFCLKNYL